MDWGLWMAVVVVVAVIWLARKLSDHLAEKSNATADGFRWRKFALFVASTVAGGLAALALSALVGAYLDRYR